MLQRDVKHFPDHITNQHEFRLSQTLMGFLPQEACITPGYKKPVIPVGHHLIWFNAAIATNELLPDGTDALQSPGGPWVRRMWAGGSLQVKADAYFDKSLGFVLDTPMLGTECIKKVELRGEGDAAKIFVTVERRFARVDHLAKSYTEEHGSLGRATGLERVQGYFAEQIRKDEGWGHALLKEERNLVFFKKVAAAEARNAHVKYLTPPGERNFAHTLTPNRTLLFRFSALTFNAHRIHLDPDYARKVEGHRNLLVHGPLSLVLLLQVFNHHVAKETEGMQVVESIEYRNLSPLYCDEEMRICGFKKKTLFNGAIYDVWIEGPTGGVAVTGTIYTTMREKVPPPSDPKPAPQTNTTILTNDPPILQSQAMFTPQSNSTTSSAGSEQHIVPEYKASFIRLEDEVLRRRMHKSRRDADKAETKAAKKQQKLLDKAKKAAQKAAQREKQAAKKAMVSTSTKLEALSEAHDSAEPDTTPSHESASSADPSGSEPASETEHPNELSSPPSTSSGRLSRPQGENAETPTSYETTSQPQYREVTPSSTLAPSLAYDSKPRTRLRAYKFIVNQSPPPTIRVVKTLRPAKPTISVLTKRIIHRLTHRYKSPKMDIKPIPLLRKHATRDRRNPDVTAARYSRYLQQGVRLFDTPSIRYITPLKEPGYRVRR
ncbi:hypothetical protein PtrSN002B_005106 [Pyrenophora tritici-repentis]|uniref:Uncharacterized protein n=1 Tax=Pyrenophora tritici-repentis TaxID=45151 RepID=A0A2W1I3T2_9PLEO|nr:hypothetical protein PtrV1_01432 [Pyrenophora tritici-repentis]KAF7454170.1 hypothetical protein A1F99_014280 [Pyrenophora tritici-repentis]KAF7577263.1 hypothetical protein PtrM4_015030 [Pyrenophora tritici-repentis]KAI0584315.1 hypothetical protein Alg130_05260 [Pyrenophora tritici-repentis]KAI0611724.1 hypothetical protein TUN205_04033 [Pyrenophora tritici-repentis]